jgi:hypothetical protein
MKRLLKLGYAGFIMTLLLAACDRPVVGPFEGDAPAIPRFSVQATVGGAPLNLQAGTDGYVLKAVALPDSSGPFAKRSNSAMVHQQDEQNHPGLRISLLHSPWSAPGAQVDSALAPGLMDLGSLDGLGDVRLVRLKADVELTTSADPVQSVQWEFLDGTTESGIEIVKAFPLFPPVQWVQYTVTHQSGCQRSIVNLLRLQASGEFELKLDRNPGHNIEVDIEVPGPQSAWDVEVDMGDGSPIRNSFGFHHHYNQPGVYVVEARVYPQNNPTLAWLFRKEVATEPEDCYAAFDYELEGTGTLPFQGRRAEVKFADGQGNTYVSSAHAGGQLAVLDHESFMPNPLGQQVYMANMQLDAWLYNEVDPMDSIYFQADTLRFGFAF